MLPAVAFYFNQRSRQFRYKSIKLASSKRPTLRIADLRIVTIIQSWIKLQGPGESIDRFEPQASQCDHHNDRNITSSNHYIEVNSYLFIVILKEIKGILSSMLNIKIMLKRKLESKGQVNIRCYVNQANRETKSIHQW